MSFYIQIKNFEGPLDLLLYLIQKEEMDIFDIPIYKITKKYMDSLKIMHELNLDIAGEFVTMAASLIQIKSQMLLPKEERNKEEEEGLEDPRETLVQKLLEYKKFKIASNSLYKRDLLGRDVWYRGGKEHFMENETHPNSQEKIITLGQETLFFLSHYYKKLIENKKTSFHFVEMELPSITSRIMKIKDQFQVGQITHFKELISDQGNKQQLSILIVTFLSVLELVRLGVATFSQNQHFGDIYISTKKAIQDTFIQNIESSFN